MENKLNITYAPDKSLGADSFWAYMIQKADAKEDSTATTYAEAAQIIDSMYDIKPCGTETEQTEADGSTAAESSTSNSIEDEDFSTYEEYKERMNAAFLPVYDPCENIFLDGSYNATLLIYRSDITKPYKLNLGNAEVVSTVIQTSDVSIVLPINGDTVQVELPIQEGLESNFEIADWNSKTVLFKKNIIGTVNLTYKTNFEEVIINVKEVDGEPGECQCLLFYEKTVSEVNITAPDIDEEAQLLLNCSKDPTSDSGITEAPFVADPERLEECYQRYIYTTMCNCAPFDSVSSPDAYSVPGQEEAPKSFDLVVQVPCDIPFSSPTPEGVYNSWQDAVYINGYVYCPGLEPWEGHAEEYYIEKCCVPPPDDISLPICREFKAIDYGGKDIIKGKEFYVGNALTGEIINFVPVGPKNGICGEITYVQDVASKNCCDDPFYEDILLLEDDCVEVLADNSSGYVFWEKGIGNYEVSVRGQGFYLDYLFTTQDIVTSNKLVTVYTDDACGSGTVTITDGCTEVSWVINATDGTWVLVHNACNVKGIKATEYRDVAGTQMRFIVTAYYGKYKIEQYVILDIFAYATLQVYPSCPDAPSSCSSCDSSLMYQDLFGVDPCGGDGDGWDNLGCVSWKGEEAQPGMFDYYATHYGAVSFQETDCEITYWLQCNAGDYSVDYRCMCNYMPKKKHYWYEPVVYEWRC